MSKILFVDDEKDFLENLEILFTQFDDVSVDTVSDSTLVLKKAIQNPPDIIFLDISMPKMDGPDVALALHENASTAHIPIVFLTAIVSNAEKGDHGGQYFLPKPTGVVDILELTHKLAPS